LSLCQNNNTLVPRTWRWYQHILSLSDLSVVLVSDRPCFEVKIIMLKGVTLNGSAPHRCHGFGAEAATA
jgi:hypothetical protein